jgi:hypothetical protein
MSASDTSQITFHLFVLGEAPMPKVTRFFSAAYGTSPEAVGLFMGPSESWDGASLNHVVFRRLRVTVDRLPPGVQRAAAGRQPPHFVLEASSTVPQPDEMAAFIRENLLPALADQTEGVVADPAAGLLYTGRSSAPRRPLPWNYLDGAPDPGADDWSDI